MMNLVLAILACLSLILTFWRWIVSELFLLHICMPKPGPLPGLTLLKPLKGCDAETRRCLQSWFEQKYPGPVQILCGVATEDDPVCDVVRGLLADYPCADAQLIICQEKLGANGKVSTLQQLEPYIRHPLIMVSDADVLVGRDFAAGVAPLLAAPGTGLVNCFYRLASPATTAMRWEALAINADYWSQVLQARSLGLVDFALGAVMSMPASSLRQIGGFARMADYLADDYELGRNIAQSGGRIEFANAVVDCREAPVGWNTVWKHQLRWARTIRACRPLPYFMSVLGNATLWPLLWLLAQRDSLAALFFLAAVLFRIVSAARQNGRLTQSNAHWADWWLTPVKDLLDVFMWAAAFWGNHIEWCGERYRILDGGKLLRIKTLPESCPVAPVEDVVSINDDDRAQLPSSS
jgi:ceramide glucosyltransferase